jgi:hypothetical protein
MSEDIIGPGVTVTGGSKVGNISRTGPGVKTPTPPNPTFGPGGGITVTGGSSTGHIAYGPGAVAGGGQPSPNWAECASDAGQGGGESGWPDAGGTTGGGGGGGGEFGDLATVRRFAEQICALGEGSDFIQVIKACAQLKDMVRDFGGDMNREAVAFMEAATAVAAFGEQLRDQAAQVAGVARDMSGA